MESTANRINRAPRVQTGCPLAVHLTGFAAIWMVASAGGLGDRSQRGQPLEQQAEIGSNGRGMAFGNVPNCNVL
jgi:hypothetical protein